MNGISRCRNSFSMIVLLPMPPRPPRKKPVWRPVATPTTRSRMSWYFLLKFRQATLVVFRFTHRNSSSLDVHPSWALLASPSVRLGFVKIRQLGAPFASAMQHKPQQKIKSYPLSTYSLWIIIILNRMSRGPEMKIVGRQESGGSKDLSSRIVEICHQLWGG